MVEMYEWVGIEGEVRIQPKGLGWTDIDGRTDLYCGFKEFQLKRSVPLFWRDASSNRFLDRGLKCVFLGEPT